VHADRRAQRNTINLTDEEPTMACETGISDGELRAQAADNTLAANPLIGVRQEDIIESANVLFQRIMANPGLAATQYAAFLGELGRIASGSSELAPDVKDKRFVDAAWKDAPVYRALAQSYLAWSGALNRFVDQAEMEDRDRLRARFIVSLFVDAMAPTNTINGNPAALKKLVDTGGASLRQGMENFARDLASNGGLPAQVDGRKFAVGENLATTPGAVVYRSPVMELIQYKPVGDEVYGRPLLIAPPQINKFYVFDLTPEKSIVRFALAGGLQTFAISWKNPTPAEGHFGLDTYVEGLEEAADVICDITGSEDVNIWGFLLRRHHHVGLPRQSRRARRAQGSQRHRRGMRARHRSDAGHHRRNLRHPGIGCRSQECFPPEGRGRGQGAGTDVRLDAAERSDLELLGEQLSARQRPAGLRHPLLE
jgi:Poly-beta-hydroxybutyrate polymerase (PhaC) N-terminus